MHIQDIHNAAIDRERFPTEEGFRILVGYPHEGRVEGEDPQSMADALEAVCDALMIDLGSMPRSTVDFINSIAGEPQYLPHESRYCDGAQRVRANLKKWEDRFATHARDRR
jgi:hypothetical protein